MLSQNISIFNDVLGPVITGPSSSHTGGAVRIGLLIRNLLPEFREAVVYVEDFPGAYGPTLEGFKSADAFTAGLLGMDVDDARIRFGRKMAEERDLSVRFSLRTFPGAEYVGMAAIRLSSDDTTVEAVAASIGGGMVRLLEIDGVPVDIWGSANEVLVLSDGTDLTDLEEAAIEVIKKETKIVRNMICKADRQETGEPGLKEEKNSVRQILEICTEDPLSSEARKALEDLARSKGRVCYIDAILTVSERAEQQPLPFTTVPELNDYMERTGCGMMEAAVRYEMAVSGWSRERVLHYAESLVREMRRSAEEGLAGDFKLCGFAKTHSKILRDATETHDKLLPLGIADKALYYAMAVMELNGGMGSIVTCPTAGSSGVVPGMLLAMQEEMELTMEEAAEGLMVAGLIGLFVAILANFDGSDGGCQAEMSSACAMGAAMACYLIGGSDIQIQRAAVLCFEGLMGLVCDPIAVYVEVPCIPRNPMGAAVAFTMTNLARSGYDPLVPLDEIIIAMRDTGAGMPPDLRCQRGGTCLTPTAKRIAAEMEAKNQFRFD